MNVWEHYIKKVKSVTPNEEASAKCGKPCVDVLMEAGCTFGEVEEHKKTWPGDHWEEVQKQGYFMA